MSKEKFERIINRIKEKYPDLEIRERLQINYYYDTDDHYLLDRHTTLRVRQIGSELSLEMKESVLSAKELLIYDVNEPSVSHALVLS